MGRGVHKGAGQREKLDPSTFAEWTGVSRETRDSLSVYADRLARWQKRMNLVGRASLEDLWHRHFFDSAQLWDFMKESDGRVVDIGSGAGFPGLVLAIMGRSDVVLIEANARKCAFLRSAATATQTMVTVREGRAETVPGADAAFVVARACAPMQRLLPLVHRHIAPDGTVLLLKGQRVSQELTEAAKDWTMDVARYPSRSDPSGVILAIRGLQPNRDNHVHASFSVDD